MDFRKIFNSPVQLESGFTLVELLTVITIIAVLGIAGALVYNSTQQKVRDAKRASEIKTIASAVATSKNFTTNSYLYAATDQNKDFQSGVPDDPNASRHYCMSVSTTNFDPPSVCGSNWSTGCPTTSQCGGATYVDLPTALNSLAKTSPAVLSWTICASLENSSTPYCLSNYTLGGDDLKPVIYLYPPQEENITVKLNYLGAIVTSTPLYDTAIPGWSVKATPDGKITDPVTGKSYQYIYWEGKPLSTSYDLTTGFVVPGNESAQFLTDELRKIGLNDDESQEFMSFWLPRIQGNKYNLIHFASTEYTSRAQLNVEPQPESLLRVFMVIKPLEQTSTITPQTFTKFQRKGFTVVEWGGTIVSPF